MPPSYCFGHQHHQQPQPETQIVISSIQSIHMRSASGSSFCFRMNGELFYSPHDIHGQTTTIHPPYPEDKKDPTQPLKMKPSLHDKYLRLDGRDKMRNKNTGLANGIPFVILCLHRCLPVPHHMDMYKSIDGLCIDSPLHLFHLAGRGEPPVGVGDPCAGCNKPILDKFLLNVLERGWHASCVRCCECLQPLTDKCFSRESKLYCRNDFYR